MSASGEGGEIFLETVEVASEIVNSTTIRHRFNPETSGIFNVDCRREKKLTTSASSLGSGIDTVVRGDEIYGKFGFCAQRIFVGCKFSFFPSLFMFSVFMLVSQVFMPLSIIFQWGSRTRVGKHWSDTFSWVET